MNIGTYSGDRTVPTRIIENALRFRRVYPEPFAIRSNEAGDLADQILNPFFPVQ